MHKGMVMEGAYNMQMQWQAWQDPEQVVRVRARGLAGACAGGMVRVSERSFGKVGCEICPEPEHDENGSGCLTDGWSSPSSSKKHICKRHRTSSSPTNFVLRDLHFDSIQAEIPVFLKQAGVSQDELASNGGVVLMVNAQGRPSGFGDVHLRHTVDPEGIQQNLYMQRFGGRYIEALPARPPRKHGGGAERRGNREWRR